MSECYGCVNVDNACPVCKPLLEKMLADRGRAKKADRCGAVFQQFKCIGPVGHPGPHDFRSTSEPPPTPPLPDVVDREKVLERTLLMAAASNQGGHSAAGREIAEVFGIPFPITMENLVARAAQLGYDQDDLWPWLRRMQEARRNEGG